jgi:phosphoribosylanthranilate isomerase
VKVCGITRAEDALAAVGAGARAVGFVFVPGSPREVTPEIAAAIGRLLPRSTARVGVIADLAPAAVRALVRTAGLNAIQAQGNETPEACAAYGVPAVKAFAAAAGFDPTRLLPFRRFPVLLDGGRAAGVGGTGSPADWRMAGRARAEGYRVLLAGGLGPENVLEAVRAVGPLAVDLNSGVEEAPGRKDPSRIAAAIRALAFLAPPEETTWPW